MSVAELRRELMGLHHQLGAKSPSTLRKVEVQRLIPIYKDIIARQSSTPLPKESHHLPPREITETAKTSEGIEVPVVPPKRPTQDRKAPTKAKDIVIVHDTGDAETVEVKKAHVKKEKVKVEKPVAVSAEPAPEKKKRVMTDEQKAKMKAGRDAMKAKKTAPTAPTAPPAPAPAVKLPSGVRPLA